MKKALIWIAEAILLVALIAGASALYSKLGEDYDTGGVELTDPPKDTSGESQPSDKDPSGSDSESGPDSTSDPSADLDSESGPDSNPESDSGTADSTNNEDTPTDNTISAPNFTVTDMNGNKIKLSDMKGKPVVVNFWATWCYYCTLEMPDFEKAYKKYGDEVVFMMVNMTDGHSETVNIASDYISDQGYSFPVYFDTMQEALYAYSVTSLPATYFFDAEGDLVARGIGALGEEDIETGIGYILGTDK